MSSIGTVFKTNLSYCMSHSEITEIICTEENARIGHMRRSSGIYEYFESFPYSPLTSATCGRNFSVVVISLSSL